MECIVHYVDQKSYGKIKKLSKINTEKIKLAKEKRQQVGGVHYHSQVDHIPDQIDPEKHGVHLEPCYKRYDIIYVYSQRNTGYAICKLKYISRLQNCMCLILVSNWDCLYY